MSRDHIRARSCVCSLPLPRGPFDHPATNPSYPTPNSTPSDPHLICPPVEMFWLSLFGLTAFFVSLTVFRILRFFWRCATSPLHQLPGPASASWLYGNVREYIEAGQAVLWDHWTEMYGNTFKFSTFFNVSPVFSTFGFYIPPTLF